MKSKRNKLLQLTVGLGVVGIIVLVIILFFSINENGKKEALTNLFNSTLTEAKKDVPNLAYEERKTDDHYVYGYYPLDESGAAIPELEKLMTKQLDAAKNKKLKDGIVYYHYAITERTEQLKSYDLYEETYMYENGKYVRKTNELLSTQYALSDKNILTFDKLLQSSFLDKDNLLSALVHDAKANDSSSEKDNLLKQLTADNLKNLVYVYTPDMLAFNVTAEESTTVFAKIKPETLIPYFNKAYVIDAYQDVYTKGVAKINAQREAEQAEKNAELVAKIKNSQPTKRVALTLDDGPRHGTTERALDIFKKYQVKATFFILGSNIAGNEEILKREVAEGHELGNHSWNHPSLVTLTAEEVKKEIEDTQEAIEKVVGLRPKSLRPPYGAVNAEVARIANLPIMLWNIDSKDWESRNADSVVQVVTSNVTPGSIILVHDIHESSVDSLERLIVNLKNEGYEFVTVSELFGEGNLVPNVTYYSADDASLFK